MMAFGGEDSGRLSDLDEVLGVETPWWDMCLYKEIESPEWNLSAT